VGARRWHLVSICLLSWLFASNPLKAQRPPSLLGGWLEYNIEGCYRLSDHGVQCNGYLKMLNGDSPKMLLSLLYRANFPPNQFMAVHGNVGATDDCGNGYPAVRMSIANKANYEDGNMAFTLTPNVATLFTIYFNSVVSGPVSFARIRIPIIDPSLAAAPTMELVFVNVQVQ
jgi:hypothetical protein